MNPHPTRGESRVASVIHHPAKIDNANREAVQRLIEADPVLVDVDRKSVV